VVHHSSSGDPDIDPVKSLARLVHRIASLPPNTPLGTFLTEPGCQEQVAATEVAAMIRMGAAGDNLIQA
jgi:hypothetical protein